MITTHLYRYIKFKYLHGHGIHADTYGNESTLPILLSSSIYYEAEGGVIELLETGAPYAPHVKAKITRKRKIEICVSKLCLERGKSCVRSFQTGFRITPTVTKMV